MAARSVLLTSLAIVALWLTACGGGAGSGGSSAGVVPVPSATVGALAAPATSSPLASGTMSGFSGAFDVRGVANALARSQRADGAIPYTATNVNPYFANIAATGVARTGANFASVRNWIAWYVARGREGNPWGIPGAVTDYTILNSGALQSTGSADSIDAYAATFLTLVSTAWQYGDTETRAYVQSIRGDVERIASSIDAVTDSDGLTWALPTYRIKYVTDASEVYAGLNDLAVLRAGAFGDVAGSLAAGQRAATLRATILATYWNDARGTFAVAVDARGVPTLPDLAVWSDAMTQLAPILHGVIAPSSITARGIYDRFNAAFPTWTALTKPDAYPWSSVAYVALLMNDAARANAYRGAVQAGYAPAFAYPWYCAESGWYLRVVDGLIAPQTIAAD